MSCIGTTAVAPAGQGGEGRLQSTHSPKEAFSIGVFERHVDPANTVVINFRTESGKGVCEKARWMSLLFG